MLSRPIAEHIHTLYARRGPDECWPWHGAVFHSGHPRTSGEYRTVMAHRFVFELANGPLNGHRIELTCGNKLCMNPAHMRVTARGGDPAPFFWAKVERRDPDECWPWTGALNSSGYGNMKWPNGLRSSPKVRAHRIAWELTHGTPPPNDMLVCHRCDNRPCCNPQHLYVGTFSDNNRDTCVRLRRRSKLSADDVRQIRARPQESPTLLGREFHVSQALIHAIRQGRVWKHLL